MPSKIVHGYQTCQHPLYSRYGGIRDRCYNPNHKDWKSYGGRGITIWEPWRQDFAAFAEYVVSEIGWPKPGQQLDRIDNDKGYVPGNLQWLYPRENNHKRSNVSGIPGINMSKTRFGTYRVAIGFNLGTVDSEEEAELLMKVAEDAWSRTIESMMEWGDVHSKG
jgi:hypothetical protein